MIDIRQARRDLANIQSHGLTELANTNRTALNQLNTWNTRGYPAGNTTTRIAGHADPTGHAAAHTDDITQRLETLCTALADISRGLDQAYAIRSWARPLTTREALDTLIANRPTAACQECGAVPAGTRNDRIKAGRCPACYMNARRGA